MNIYKYHSLKLERFIQKLCVIEVYKKNFFSGKKLALLLQILYKLFQIFHIEHHVLFELKYCNTKW